MALATLQPAAFLPSLPVTVESTFLWESYDGMAWLGPISSRQRLLLLAQKPVPGHRQLLTDLLTKGCHLRAKM